MPNRNSPPATSGMPPGPSRQPAATTTMPATAVQAIVLTVRISPIQPISRPDREVPKAEPTAADSSTSPRTPGPTPSSARTWGIREAQLAKMNPAPKKTA